MKATYVNLMIGWAIALCVLGSVAAAGIAAVTGADSTRAIGLWMSLWWSWVPVGLLIGFLVGRNST